MNITVIQSLLLNAKVSQSHPASESGIKTIQKRCLQPIPKSMSHFKCHGYGSHVLRNAIKNPLDRKVVSAGVDHAIKEYLHCLCKIRYKSLPNSFLSFSCYHAIQQRSQKE